MMAITNLSHISYILPFKCHWSLFLKPYFRKWLSNWHGRKSCIRNTLVTKIWSSRNTNTNNRSFESFNDSRPPRSYNGGIPSGLEVKKIWNMAQNITYVIKYTDSNSNNGPDFEETPLLNSESRCLQRDIMSFYKTARDL